jgi:methylphosphotriester-DNA--protein-cysteine methyltransferase
MSSTSNLKNISPQSKVKSFFQLCQECTTNPPKECSRCKEEQWIPLEEWLKLNKQVKELQLVAESAHETAQFTMDANRRQVIHITELRAKLTEVNKILMPALEVISAHLEEYGTYEIILPYEAIKRLREVLSHE